MAKTINVGYIPWFEKSPLTFGQGPVNYYGWADIAHFDLEKLDTWRGSKLGFMNCPAFVKYVEQVWVVKCPIDVTIKWDKYNKALLSNLPSMAHDAFVKVHWGDFDPDVDTPIVALNAAMLFFSDEPDVWVEQLPPFNHIDPAWRIMPGSFNIHNWQRPVVPTFEMFDEEISFKRGQPLAYIRFRSKDPLDTFKPIKQERTEEHDHLVNSSVSVKSYHPKLSWKVVTGQVPNKLRQGKKLVKTEPWICRLARRILRK